MSSSDSSDFPLPAGDSSEQVASASICSTRPKWAQYLVFFLVLGCFWFGFTRHLDWPFYLHPDERGKAQQVIEKEYNFNHPMLMLLSTQRVVKVLREVTDFKRNFQSVTEVGRVCVAFFLALGIASLCTLAWRWHGWIGLVVLGLLFFADGHSYRTAQHFKEDGVLLGMLGLCLLSLDGLIRHFTTQVHHGKALNKSLVFFGLCVGLVAASKYVGFLFWPVAIVLVARIAPSPQKFASCLWMLLFAFIGFFMANYPMLTDFAGMKGGLAYEFESLTHGHDGVRAKGESVINTQAISALSKGFMPSLLWLSLCLVPLIFWLQKRGDSHKRTKVGFAAYSAWFVCLSSFVFCLLLLIALSLTPKFTYRYLTPVIWLALACLGFGISALLREGLNQILSKKSTLLKQCLPICAAVGLLGALLFTQWFSWKDWGPELNKRFAAYKTIFHTSLEWHRMYQEGRGEQLAVIQAVSELPADAVILMPHQPLLPAQNKKTFKNIPSPVKQTVFWDKTVTKDPSLQELNEYNPTHVLFQINIHKGFEGPEIQGDPEAVEKFYAQRYFWRNLLKQSKRINSQARNPKGLTYGWELRELQLEAE